MFPMLEKRINMSNLLGDIFKQWSTLISGRLFHDLKLLNLLYVLNYILISFFVRNQKLHYEETPFIRKFFLAYQKAFGLTEFRTNFYIYLFVEGLLFLVGDSLTDSWGFIASDNMKFTENDSNLDSVIA